MPDLSRRPYTSAVTRALTEPHLEDLERQVERLGPAIPAGPALLLGWEHRLAERLLAGSLRTLDIAVFSPEEVVICHGAMTAAIGWAVQAVDPATVRFGPRTYAAVVVAALATLAPPLGDRLVKQAKEATQPGGLVFVAAPTTDDAEGERWHALGLQVDRHTYRRPDGNLARFVVPGELSMGFEGWSLLQVAHRFREPAGQDEGRRAWAMVVARRPLCGTLLA